MKVIIPRQTKLTAERATFSRAKYDVATCTDFDVKSVCSFDLDINKKCEKDYQPPAQLLDHRYQRGNVEPHTHVH